MVKIRLRRLGSRNQPTYRVVVAESASPREGRFIETLGHYNPLRQPALIVIDEEKALKWLRQGAQPTETARSLLAKQGIWQKFRAAAPAAPTPESSPAEASQVTE
ncbi:MAG: 30S ribosomal protein S16 [Armatimonadetes bacterium]|nr:30S ribosomal protein S16 [Armatimonadota bacterium]